MESNSWSFRFSNSSSSSSSSSSSRRRQSRSDLFLGGGYEEIDGDEDFKAQFLCPFCAEDFDIVGLCCHIDEEHPVEAKNGVCPVCAKRVGMDIVSHITMQHGNFLKISFLFLVYFALLIVSKHAMVNGLVYSLTGHYVQRKRRLRKGGSNLTFSMLRKELREGNLQALLGGSSFLTSPNVEADPLLSSFMFSPPTGDEPLSLQPLSIAKASVVKESGNKEFLGRKPQQSQLSDKDHEEKARRCKFIQGLLMSTFLDDNL
ncbi:protein DEHYDRATION-INDUCED 19-like protein 4-like isoform X1 [Gossypium australe]|uniref:Protein DEHYDRATION-INDUCED 19-like protein 4-like isoform X1 n=1 Tax=Gossypium australe TaxID=47621 RepID=A0A5B6UAV0_9ROSI|nr:protein DEHYDRATION-INDUCED 19-like protein 4-like isoform X1 [Gossypium australe]